MKSHYQVTLLCFEWCWRLKETFRELSSPMRCAYVKTASGRIVPVRLTFRVLGDFTPEDRQAMREFLAAPSGIVFVPYTLGMYLMDSRTAAMRHARETYESLKGVPARDGAYFIGIGGRHRVPDWPGDYPVRNWTDFSFVTWVPISADLNTYLMAVEQVLYRHCSPEVDELDDPPFDFPGDSVWPNFLLGLDGWRTYPFLEELTGEEREEGRATCLAQLKYLTGQDFGYDTQAWSAWLKAHPNIIDERTAHGELLSDDEPVVL